MTHSVKTSERTVSDLGETGILDVILPILRAAKPVLGPGDDAGVLKIQGGEVLASVDTIVENQDFRRLWPSGVKHRAFDIGWKSAAQNLSDINAMGGRTTGVLSSLSLPADTPISWVENFARGFAQALRDLPAAAPAVLGGDLGLSGEISITTTVLGEADGVKVLRSGAKPGHVLAVTGRVGVASAGLALLESTRPSSTWSRSLHRLVQGQLRPEPPLESGPRAAAAGASAMLDLSDGLIVDAERLAKASGVDLRIDSAPLAEFTQRLQPAASLLQAEPFQWVLYGGEDFGLLAAFPDLAAVPEEFTVIGQVAAASGAAPTVFIDNEKMAGSKGFDHFS